MIYDILRPFEWFRLKIVFFNKEFKFIFSLVFKRS